MPNEENILIIKGWQSIDSETHWIQFVGALQCATIVYGPLFAKLTKPFNALLKKGGCRPLNENGGEGLRPLEVP